MAVVLFGINVFGVLSTQENGRNVAVSQIQVKAKYINIRKEKSTNSEILGKVKYGEWYDIISEDKESKY
jgi:hypothetical protein